MESSQERRKRNILGKYETNFNKGSLNSNISTVWLNRLQVKAKIHRLLINTDSW